MVQNNKKMKVNKIEISLSYDELNDLLDLVLGSYSATIKENNLKDEKSVLNMFSDSKNDIAINLCHLIGGTLKSYIKEEISDYND